MHEPCLQLIRKFSPDLLRNSMSEEKTDENEKQEVPDHEHESPLLPAMSEEEKRILLVPYPKIVFLYPPYLRW